MSTQVTSEQEVGDFFTAPTNLFGEESTRSRQDQKGDSRLADASQLQTDKIRDTAIYLSSCRIEGDYAAFEQACTTAGLNKPGHIRNAQFYWDRMTGRRSSQPIEKAKTNTDLVGILGIELNNADVPRCTLLYDLFQANHELMYLAEIAHGQHVGGKPGKNANQRFVNMYDIRNSGKKPWYTSIVSLFQGKTAADIIDHRVLQKAGPLIAELGHENGLKLGELLFRLQMILPDATSARLIGDLIKKGLNGEEIILTGAFCPDYAYEKTGDPNLPYRYTFDGLGEGVGLVALQFARVIPAISNVLTEFGITHRIILGIGDFEADSPSILTRVGLTYDEFVGRCKKSLDAFRAAIGENVPLELELCDADRCKGRLRPYAAKATQRMLYGDFGRMHEVYGDPQALVNQIVQDNGTFYKRWYSPDISEEEIRRKVLEQGGEYAALAQIYREDLGPNVLVISGDRPLMHAFDAHSDVFPTLCVKRAY